MPAKKKKRKGGGRVTPKGTVNPSKKTNRAVDDTAPPDPPRQFRRRDMVEKGRGARPITHNRGNR